MRKDILLRKLGGAIRSRRYLLGMSQLELAERTGCSLQAIGSIERGLANPSIFMVYRIAIALEIRTKELIP